CASVSRRDSRAAASRSGSRRRGEVVADGARSWTRNAAALLLGNLHYKLVGLLVAISAWLFVQGEQVVTDRVRAAIDWITPVGLVTTEELPATVVLTVEGPRNAVRRAQRA